MGGRPAILRDYPAYILFFGVGLEACTAIHHPEEAVAPEIYVKPIEQAERYELRPRQGTPVTFMRSPTPRQNQTQPRRSRSVMRR